MLAYFEKYHNQENRLVEVTMSETQEQLFNVPRESKQLYTQRIPLAFHSRIRSSFLEL
jgi:hypothetical protein